MHVETLRTFCDLVETGSFSLAAKRNRVTQSAVSQQLRALEQRYGARLLERAPRARARPTEAGRTLYQGLLPLLESLAALERKLREPAGVIAGSVRVSTVYSVGLHTLPRAMKKFLQQHPQVSVRLEYRRTDQVYDACLSGDADFGIVALPSHRPQLEVVALRADELVIVVPPEHRLARARKLSLAALDGEAFIAFERDIPTRRLIDRALRRAGVTVNYAMELDNVETIKRSVEAGLGISILPLPAIASEVRAGTLRARHFAEGPLSRAIGLMHRRNRELSSAAQAFLALLRAELGSGSVRSAATSRH
jgi:DNA-binding transcriptional LysR family regulator